MAKAANGGIRLIGVGFALLSLLCCCSATAQSNQAHTPQTNTNTATMLTLDCEVSTSTLNWAEQTICHPSDPVYARTQALAYAERNTQALYAAELARLKAGISPYQEGDYHYGPFIGPRDPEQLQANHEQWLIDRNDCQDEACLLISILNQAYEYRYGIHRESRAEVGLFGTRLLFWYFDTDQTAQDFLTLIDDYHIPDSVNLDVTFEVTEDLAQHLPSSNKASTLCDDFVQLMNQHPQKQELVCGLPDLSHNPKFQYPTLTPISADALQAQYPDLDLWEVEPYQQTLYTLAHNLSRQQDANTPSSDPDDIPEIMVHRQYPSHSCYIGNGYRKPYNSIIGVPQRTTEHDQAELDRLRGNAPEQQYLGSYTDVIAGTFENPYHSTDEYEGFLGWGQPLIYEGQLYFYDGVDLRYGYVFPEGKSSNYISRFWADIRETLDPVILKARLIYPYANSDDINAVPICTMQIMVTSTKESAS